MIKLSEITDQTDAIDATLTLPMHMRSKSRLRVRLDNGEDAGLFLTRGTTLRDGDLLRTEDGYTVLVRAADETLSSSFCSDPHLLCRACYHLGNRHVPIQIEPNRVSYLHDHVLDEMLRGLGLSVEVIEAPFEPEPGAYGGNAQQGHHRHAHGHGHDHQH